MEIRLLGPVEVLSECGDRTPIGSAKQRALLALLALQPGRLVTVDGLIERLWGDAPPEGSAKALRFHVSRLRRALRELGCDDVLQTRPGGYALALDEQMIDACCFETAVSCARAARASGADPDTVAAMLRAALELWRGEPLADLGDEPFVLGERRRLDDLRLGAVEEYYAAELLAGHHAEAVAELEREVGRHPLRERLWELLITALYRSNRQADALAAYQRLRRTLVDELGLEPSEPLRALEGRILVQHQELAAPPPPTPEVEGLAPPEAPRPPPEPIADRWRGPGEGAPGPSRGGGRLAVGVVAAALVLGSAALATAVLLFSTGRVGTPWSTADRTTTGERSAEPSGGEQISTMRLRPSDCFDTLPIERRAPDANGVVPADPVVLRLDCDEPHEQEVFHIFELPSGPYPGPSEVDRMSQEQCASEFKRYVGIEARFSVLEFLYVTPREADWTGGFRWGGCSLYHAAGDQLVGSMAGSRR